MKPAVAALFAAMLALALFLTASPRTRVEAQQPLGHGSVIGKVFSADGKPWSQARVRMIRLSDAASGKAFLADADEGGAFRFADVPVGEYKVSVKEDRMEEGRGGYLETAFRLENGGTVSVELRTAQGAPVAGRIPGASKGILVKLLPLEAPSGPYRIHLARTQKNGEFFFLNVLPGRYMLVARQGEPLFSGGSGWTSTKVAIEVGPNGADQVELAFGSAVLEGSVVERDGGAPVAGVPVSVRDPDFAKPPFEHLEWHDSIVEGVVRTDKDGHFRIAGLRPGRRTVWIAAPQHAAWEQSVEVGGASIRAELERVK